MPAVDQYMVNLVRGPSIRRSPRSLVNAFVWEVCASHHQVVGYCEVNQSYTITVRYFMKAMQSNSWAVGFFLSYLGIKVTKNDLS